MKGNYKILFTFEGFLTYAVNHQRISSGSALLLQRKHVLFCKKKNLSIQHTFLGILQALKNICSVYFQRKKWEIF